MFPFSADELRSKCEELEKKFPDYQENKEICISDGPINCEEYVEALPRIVFSLKESYDGFRHIRKEKNPEIAGWGPGGGSPVFFPNMQICTYILTNLYLGKECPALEWSEIQAIGQTPNSKVGYTNIKKTLGKSESNEPEITEHFNKNYELSREQMELLDPHIIILCGTGQNTTADDEWLFEVKNEISNWVWQTCDEKRIFIDWYHLSNRLGYEVNYNKFREIVYNPAAAKVIKETMSRK